MYQLILTDWSHLRKMLYVSFGLLVFVCAGSAFLASQPHAAPFLKASVVGWLSFTALVLGAVVALRYQDRYRVAYCAQFRKHFGAQYRVPRKYRGALQGRVNDALANFARAHKANLEAEEDYILSTQQIRRATIEQTKQHFAKFKEFEKITANSARQHDLVCKIAKRGGFKVGTYEDHLTM